MSRSSSTDLRWFQILVVDDDGLIRKAIRHLLEPYGHTIIEAPNGKYALDLLDQHHVDVVITDLYMPTMDGLELARAIRKRPEPWPRLIGITGVNVEDQHLRELAAELGAVATLAKPFTREQLLEALGEA
jgi:CheY-like chemotaxis protein